MEIKVQRLAEGATLPTYGSTGAACFDLYAYETEPVMVHPQGRAVINTGLAFQVPEGYVMLVFSRSGQGFKNGIRLVNCVGVIDSDYRGEVKVGLHNDGQEVYEVNNGDRVAQAMLVPVDRHYFTPVEALDATERGTDGFGSTGK